MAVVRWTFYDAALSETYEFEVNPREGGTPSYRKNITYQNTTAPGGRTLMFEGADEPMKLAWSGVILTQDHHETFVDWYYKRHQILLTDDLSRQYTIYITSYDPKRERSRQYPYKHSYQMEATILDWTE